MTPQDFWPGQPLTAHRGIEDPSAVRGTDERKRKAFSKTYGQLLDRLSILVSLPVDKLDRASLMAKLDEIGRLGKESE